MFVAEVPSTGDFVDILLDALYTPKNTAVCDDTRVCEIPNLNSGIASAAKKFAKRWRIVDPEPIPNLTHGNLQTPDNVAVFPQQCPGIVIMRIFGHICCGQLMQKLVNQKKSKTRMTITLMMDLELVETAAL